MTARVDLAALRATATEQHYSSQDIHGVSVKPSTVLALVEAVEAAQRLVNYMRAVEPFESESEMAEIMDAALAPFAEATS